MYMDQCVGNTDAIEAQAVATTDMPEIVRVAEANPSTAEAGSGRQHNLESKTLQRSMAAHIGAAAVTNLLEVWLARCADASKTATIAKTRST